MKQHIKKWTFRLTVTGLLIIGLLLVIILNPFWIYANKTTHKNFTIYHNQQFDNIFLEQIDKANQFLNQSEFYSKNLKLDICLNDGSYYSKLVETIGGRAFARGFYDKIVLFGNADFKNNFVELKGYKWNLTQLLAHEMTHCLQFDKLGLWKSKPFANIPNWKWEGYAEYVARQNNDQKDLLINIDRFLATNENNWEVVFGDSTIVPREYYNSWTLIQYSLDIKKMNYSQILSDTTNNEIIKREMMKWYNEQNK